MSTHKAEPQDKAAHTPGPWCIDSDGNRKPDAIITSPHDETGPDDDVCEVYGGNADNDDERKANAHLIAAAPELLAALDRTTAWLDNLHSRGDSVTAVDEAITAARAAIAKAEGR